MKDRKPYDLKRVIQLYNAVQVVLSIYLVWEVGISALICNFQCHQFANCQRKHS